MDDSYKDDLKIDKTKLDVEWEFQSLLFMKWAEAHAQAIFERDKVKEQLDFVRSEIDENIRVDFESYGFDKKPTEAAISAKIIMTAKYKVMYEKLAEANKNVNILAGAREAMNHKKKALENITQLWTMGYFSDPKIPNKIKDDSDIKNKRNMREDIDRSIRRRKNK